MITLLKFLAELVRKLQFMLLGELPSETYLWLVNHVFDPLRDALTYLIMRLMDKPWIDHIILAVVVGAMAWHYGRRLHELVTRKRLKPPSLTKWPLIFYRDMKNQKFEYIVCLKRYDRARDWKWRNTLYGFLVSLNPLGVLLLILSGLAWFLGLLVPEVASWLPVELLKKLVVVGVSGILLGNRHVSRFLTNLVTRRTTWIYFNHNRIKIRHSGMSIVRKYRWAPSGFSEASMKYRGVVSKQGGGIELIIEDAEMVKHIPVCDPIDGEKTMKASYAIQAVLGEIRKGQKEKLNSSDLPIVDV